MGKIRLILLVVVVTGAGLVCLIEFTDWQQLEAVTLDGVPVENWESLGLDPQVSILEQPLVDVAERLLRDDQIARVDIDFELPASLTIETNRFSLVATVVDRTSGRLFGLNRQGRVVPLRKNYDNWDCPVVTGVTAERIFGLCDDARVSLLMFELERLYDENPNLYRLLDEIDFTSRDFVVVTISGLPYRLKAKAASFYQHLDSFISFIEKFEPSIDSATMIDLRFAGTILQESKRN